MVRRIELNDKAYHYLLLACTGEAFPYVESAGGMSALAWENLKKRYEADESTDLIELLEKFNQCRLKDGQSPDTWFQELEYLRKRIENSGGNKKHDMELISHVIMYAPESYKVPVEVMSSNRKNLKLDEVKQNMMNFWKRNYKDKVELKQSKNEALTA